MRWERKKPGRRYAWSLEAVRMTSAKRVSIDSRVLGRYRHRQFLSLSRRAAICSPSWSIVGIVEYSAA